MTDADNLPLRDDEVQPEEKQTGGGQNHFPCSNCGADLTFKPGTATLHCPYCDAENKIDVAEESIEELDYEAALADAEKAEATEERLTIKCQTCGAETTLEENVTGGECPFCGSQIVAQEKSTRAIKPKSLLPFKVTRKEAALHFKAWLKKLWFAPGKLKKFARTDGLNGIYSPYWTYDARTTTKYTGQRGEHYWETQTYTTTENGKTVTKTRQVRRTRWYPASGVVRNSFDDILVLGSRSLPRKFAEKLEPWDLKNLVPYTEDFLSGFRVESYSVGLPEGFTDAKQKMRPAIRRTIKRDIGGDEQRISSMHVAYRDVTFKHLLLPVWISAYNFKGKVYRFLVNARTGEVQGERPWSWVKISLAIAAAAALIGTAVWYFSQHG